MYVKDLIELLQKQDPEAQIEVGDGDDDYHIMQVLPGDVWSEVICGDARLKEFAKQYVSIVIESK